MKNVIQLLAKSVLILLGLAKATSATDAAIQEKVHDSGTTITIISNEEMWDFMEVVKSHKDYGLLIKGDAQPIENETRKQKGGYLGMLQSTLGISLLRNMTAGKKVIRTGERGGGGGGGVVRAGEGKIRVEQDLVILPHPFTSFLNE